VICKTTFILQTCTSWAMTNELWNKNKASFRVTEELLKYEFWRLKIKNDFEPSTILKNDVSLIFLMLWLDVWDNWHDFWMLLTLLSYTTPVISCLTRRIFRWRHFSYLIFSAYMLCMSSFLTPLGNLHGSQDNPVLNFFSI